MSYLPASIRHAEVNSRRGADYSGPLDRRAQADFQSARRIDTAQYLIADSSDTGWNHCGPNVCFRQSLFATAVDVALDGAEELRSAFGLVRSTKMGFVSSALYPDIQKA